MIRYCLLATGLASVLPAADVTIPGEITTPFPKLNHLAVEWQIEGDANLNASCTVRYRKRGGELWQGARPLRRVPAGASQKTSRPLAWTNRLSGTLFNLGSGTSYEVELSLRDPDGGEATQVVLATTRHEAIAATEAVVRHGTKADLNAVKPGEVLLLADGDYGAVRFTRDGEPGRPIVYCSATGKAVFSEVGLTDRKWVTHGLPFEGKIGSWTFTELPGKAHELHGLELTLEVLAKPVFPDAPQLLHEPPDLRLKNGSPEVGAYAEGETLPQYGPRF
jgi:hypothetical protein